MAAHPIGSLCPESLAIEAGHRSSTAEVEKLADFFPAVGYFRGLLLRGAYDPLRRRGVKAPARPLYRLLWARLLARVGFVACWLLVWIGEYSIRRNYLDRPGWNDYYMILWMMTGDRKYAQEIYRRASLPEGSPVSDSCRWMVNSVSKQYPDFGAVMTEIEIEKVGA